MKYKSTQIAIILLFTFLFLAVFALMLTDSNLVNPKPPNLWQPDGLATEAPALTPTNGWWNDLPTPNPVRTPTPTPEGN